MSIETIALLALIRTPGIGSVTIRQLISYCGGAAQVFDSDYKKLIKIPGVGDKMARGLLQKTAWKDAEKEWNVCQKDGVELLFYTDAKYPRRLKSLYDSPIVIYSKGEVDYNAQKTVGIVGTRQVTEYGKNVTETIIHELVPYNTLVVSGLAYGVDITAHRACLKLGLPTVGVMASGLDVIYPLAHQKTSIDMQRNGAIATENPLGTKPDFMRFPARNRIIAGLSDVVIVVESAKKGGSLITVEYAQNYHRDVYAVPGNLGNPLSEGCNQLIKNNKACLFSTVEEMATDLQWKTKEEVKSNTARAHTLDFEPLLLFEGFTQDEGQILALLKKGGEMQIDDMSWQSGIHLGKLATLLLNLEFQGMIRSMPGKKYALI
ncbi:DNA-processing protein DprA [Arundinibacter roseus]|uniref:DNA-protecting protein DprA n=1 Tax=Arundinibacter roseus TaxID=2070510 RepID=A0A4R4K9N3_9BACT|nr:DNA-processing protein DprA [Arundinibacter roseus]TDB64534.1 DNA-protecting protein DprA [Arundinibacter roseus]